MASFRCYDNSDVIATLIITNFHLYLIQLWWQFFKIFVYGDVVYAQTWEVLKLKTVSSHLINIPVLVGCKPVDDAFNGLRTVVTFDSGTAKGQH